MTEQAKQRMRDYALDWLKSADSRDINYELIGYLVTGNPADILEWLVSERSNFLDWVKSERP
jgi:hypothetical protein